MILHIYLCILYVDVKAFSREQKIINETFFFSKNLPLQKLFMRITITVCPSLFHSRVNVSRTFNIMRKVLRRLQCWIPELRATGPFFLFYLFLLYFSRVEREGAPPLRLDLLGVRQSCCAVRPERACWIYKSRRDLFD